MIATAIAALALASGAGAAGTVPAAAVPYVEGVKKVNEEHARKPGKTREEELAKRLPAAASKTLEALLKAKPSPEVLDALEACGEAALDLDLLKDFERIRTRLLKDAPDRAAKLGVALSRPRYLLRGLGGLEAPYLENFAEVFDAVLAAYDEVFGFAEWSKVPGKKIRVRIHLEEKLSRPPYFAPEFPYHSQIDFPVVDGKAFTSPDREGHFFGYGLCHELGHLIAMWGNLRTEEDFHGWAHYTGLVILEKVMEAGKEKPSIARIRDKQWTSLAKLRDEEKGIDPSLENKKGVLALLLALHDTVGPKAIGAAINYLDAQGKSFRVQHVRYYTFKEFRTALLAVLKKPEERGAVEKAFAGAKPAKAAPRRR
jgi:hypothetical protein